MILKIILYMAACLSFIYVWHIWNRKRGDGHKTMALIFMTLSLFFMQQFSLFIRTGDVSSLPWLCSIFLLDIAFLLLLFRPEWGAIFPQKLNTVHKDKAILVEETANFLSGYPYDNYAAQSEVHSIFWKITAWVGRIGLYGIPLAGLHCFIVWSIAPIFIWMTSSLFVGFIYARCYLNRKNGEDWIAQAEPLAGAYMAFILIVTLI